MNNIRENLSVLAGMFCILVMLPAPVLADDGDENKVLITEVIADTNGDVLIRVENLCDPDDEEREAVTVRLPDTGNQLTELLCTKTGTAGHTLDELMAMNVAIRHKFAGLSGQDRGI